MLDAALRARAAGDHHAAITLLLPLAARGSGLAETLLGAAYARGEGVSADPATAAAYYTRAANRGYPVAQYALARAYADGAGVPQDREKAFFWSTLAARLQLGQAVTLAAALRPTLPPARVHALALRVSRWRPWPTPTH